MARLFSLHYSAPFVLLLALMVTATTFVVSQSDLDSILDLVNSNGAHDNTNTVDNDDFTSLQNEMTNAPSNLGIDSSAQCSNSQQMSDQVFTAINRLFVQTGGCEHLDQTLTTLSPLAARMYKMYATPSSSSSSSSSSSLLDDPAASSNADLIIQTLQASRSSGAGESLSDIAQELRASQDNGDMSSRTSSSSPFSSSSSSSLSSDEAVCVREGAFQGIARSYNAIRAMCEDSVPCLDAGRAIGTLGALTACELANTPENDVSGLLAPDSKYSLCSAKAKEECRQAFASVLGQTCPERMSGSSPVPATMMHVYTQSALPDVMTAGDMSGDLVAVGQALAC